MVGEEQQQQQENFYYNSLNYDYLVYDTAAKHTDIRIQIITMNLEQQQHFKYKYK